MIKANNFDITSDTTYSSGVMGSIGYLCTLRTPKLEGSSSVQGDEVEIWSAECVNLSPTLMIDL